MGSVSTASTAQGTGVSLTMQQRPMQGMWGRYALFITLSLLIVSLNIWVLSFFEPPKQAVPQGNEKLADVQNLTDVDPTKPPDSNDETPEIVPPEEPEEPREGVSAPPEGGPEEALVAAPKAESPAFDEQWITLGSADPDGTYRMLVTLTNRGASVARVELSQRRYRDIDDRTGYMGHLVMDPTARGTGARVEVVGTGTPASVAGIFPGDLITAVASHKVTGLKSLEQALRRFQPKQTVTITLDRSGKSMKLPVTLRRRPLEVIRPEVTDPFSFLLTLSQIGEENVLENQAPGVNGETLTKEEKKSERPAPNLTQELEGLHLYDDNWEILRHDETKVVFRHTLPQWGLEVLKIYQLKPLPDAEKDDDLSRGYHLTFDIEIRNVGQSARQVAYQLDGPNGLPAEGAWYAIRNQIGGSGLRDIVVSLDDETPTTISCDDIADDDWGAIWQERSLTFVGVDAQYFSAILIPQKEEPDDIWFAESHPVRVGGVSPKKKQLVNTTCRMRTVVMPLEPGGQMAHRYEIFLGPKKPDLLAKYGLQDIVEYGWFGWVAKFMLAILHFFHSWVYNYGLAIILLTVLVRLGMFPLSRKQALGAQKMQKIQPELKKLAEKYKNNLEARGKAQRDLFKKHGYHPASGCLPIFVQLPIFIGLYRGLMVDIELRQAPLISENFRWCSNLAAPDMLYDWSWLMPEFINSGMGFFGLGPYLNILPLITVVLFLVQQKMFMPPPTDEQAAMQQNIMKFMMIFMGLIFYKVASGLCLYFIASSLWGIAERKLLPKLEHPDADDQESTTSSNNQKSKTGGVVVRRKRNALRTEGNRKKKGRSGR